MIYDWLIACRRGANLAGVALAWVKSLQRGCVGLYMSFERWDRPKGSSGFIKTRAIS